VPRSTLQRLRRPTDALSAKSRPSQ
jgi:hypothetical protein